VSVDHYVSSHKGRQYANRGSRTSDFCAGALFVDHATGMISVYHQLSLGAADTIKSKLHFERNAFEDGVVIQAYHTDNGIFSSKEFLEQLVSKGQNIRFSGSGAAHQNGVAESGIRTMVGMARTMMLHAALGYGERVIPQDLWPQAMDHAVWLYSRMPRTDTGLSPEEMVALCLSSTPSFASRESRFQNGTPGVDRVSMLDFPDFIPVWLHLF
jgi:transposase InsO family protein